MRWLATNELPLTSRTSTALASSGNPGNAIVAVTVWPLASGATCNEASDWVGEEASFGRAQVTHASSV
jgi:hypothetical protein